MMPLWPRTCLLWVLWSSSILFVDVKTNEFCHSNRWNVFQGNWINLPDCSIQNTYNTTSTDIIWAGSSNGDTYYSDYAIDSFKIEVEMEINSDEGDAGILFRAKRVTNNDGTGLYIGIFPSINQIRWRYQSHGIKWKNYNYHITPDTKYILTIVVYGRYYGIYIDNHVVFEDFALGCSTPKGCAWGSIGCLTHNASATFYSLIFTELINVHHGICNPFKPHYFIEIISIIISIICLSIIMLIFIISYKEMNKNNPTKYLYYICLFICVGIQMTNILETSICVYVQEEYISIIRMILSGFICTMYLSVLITYISRLHYAFKDSLYALNKKQIFVFIAILIIFISSGIAIYISMKHDDHRKTVVLFGITIFVYFSTAIYAVLLFVIKLLKLIMSTNINNKNNDIHQKQIIQYLSRHLTLLVLVIFTDILSYIVLAFTGYNFAINRMIRAEEMDQISMTVICIDATINILSLFVTFKFAQRYYEKYCKFWISCCKLIFTEKLKAIIIKKCQEINYDHIGIENRDYLSNTVVSENTDIELLPDSTETHMVNQDVTTIEETETERSDDPHIR